MFISSASRGRVQRKFCRAIPLSPLYLHQGVPWGLRIMNSGFFSATSSGVTSLKCSMIPCGLPLSRLMTEYACLPPLEALYGARLTMSHGRTDFVPTVGFWVANSGSAALRSIQKTAATRAQTASVNARRGKRDAFIRSFA